MIGGFGHTIGEESPKVQKKRHMLEKEGVVFDGDGKIHIDCFVDVSSEVSSTITAKGNNKKRKADTSKTTTKKKTKSKYFTDTTTTQSTTTTISEDVLKQEILTLLQKRQVGKTC